MLDNYQLRPGSVLLLSLLVLSSVLLTSMGVADLVLRSLQRSKQSDAGTIAYYAAESGIEDTLFRIRKDGRAPASLDGSGAALENTSSWTRKVATPSRIFTSLLEDQFVPVDLYDPVDITRAAGVGSVRVAWTESGCANCTTILADYVTLPVALPNQWADNATHERLPWSASGVTISLDPSAAYRIRLTAEGGDMQDFTVTAFDNAGQAMDAIPYARAEITATGSYGTARQALRVVVPRNEFLTGLFQNLIWSDCSMVKNSPAECPN